MANLTALTTRPEGRNLGREAYEILDYNQQLVQFADSKAGTLIVINSLFVAAAGASSAGSPELQVLRGLGMLLAAAAVVMCLFVVITRGEEPGQLMRADLIFFGDILKRPNAGHYASEFVRTPADVHLDDMLRRVYVVAGIARRKFQSYTWAQLLTAGSGVLWLLANLAALF